MGLLCIRTERVNEETILHSPCYSFITSSCIVIYVCRYDLHVSLMSVLQAIKGLTKELYFIIFSRRKSNSMQNWFTCFDISMSWHYNVLSGLIIIILRSKGLRENIHLCVYMQNFKFIGAMVSEFRVFKRSRSKRRSS